MIVVTGASGLLGASVVLLAQEQGREVAGLYHRHPVFFGGIKLLAVDLTDPVETSRIFQQLKPSQVVHCAAATDVDWCEEHFEEAYNMNVMVPAALAGITSETGTQFLYISTDSVFDGEREYYTELDIPAPVNVYAKTKWQGEQEVLRRNPRAAIARVNLYGWNAQNKESLAEWILKQLALGNPVRGFSDVFFCPILANDLAEVILALFDHNLSGLYHVAGADSMSKYEFARGVASTFGYDPGQVVPSHLVDAGLKARRPRNTSLNTAKICAALGHSMPEVQAGLLRFRELRESGYENRLKGHLIGVRP